MAKSLRSKWKRRMRAVKRERYGKKELDRLTNMLAAAGELPQKEDVDIKMEDSENTPKETSVSITSIPPTFKSQKKQRKERRSKVRGEGRKSRRDEAGMQDEEDDEDKLQVWDGSEDEDEEEAGKDSDEVEAMAVDKPEHVFSKRTMRDQFGNYPAWMNKRKMLTQQKKNKRIAQRRAKSLSGKRVRK